MTGLLKICSWTIKLIPTATLILLNAYKNFCPEIPFIYVSTNKVYGDNPNKIKLIEKKLRFEVDRNLLFIKESMNQ